MNEMEQQEMNWSQLLAEEKANEYFINAMNHSLKRRKETIVYPPKNKVFEAFNLTTFENLKVIILGQDPYHGKDQAHGLCFSVNKHIKIPPSLKNIYQELSSDLGLAVPSHGNLESWAKQGVLLLNSVLTVEAGHAHSHKGIGWEEFTDNVIRKVSLNASHLVFLLWGSSAQSKLSLINQNKHTVYTSVHPSPLSAYRGYFGCKHFSKTNEALKAHGQAEIDWSIPE